MGLKAGNDCLFGWHYSDDPARLWWNNLKEPHHGWQIMSSGDIVVAADASGLFHHSCHRHRQQNRLATFRPRNPEDLLSRPSTEMVARGIPQAHRRSEITTLSPSWYRITGWT